MIYNHDCQGTLRTGSGNQHVVFCPRTCQQPRLFAHVIQYVIRFGHNIMSNQPLLQAAGASNFSNFQPVHVLMSRWQTLAISGLYPQLQLIPHESGSAQDQTME